jgi:ABC-2 type transport system permease protein
MTAANLVADSPLAKYATIFKICLIERLTYRTDFFFATLMRFLPLVSLAFLWTAIFAGSPSERIAGFSSDEMVAYNLLVFIARAFSSMPGLAIGIAADIREGGIKKYLTQPVDMIPFLLASRVAHKLVYHLLASIPFAVVIFLCRGFFPGWPSPGVLALYLLALVAGFLIGFLFEVLIGLVAFWTLEITALSYLVMSIVFVLSGHMFPLDLLPEPFAEFTKWLPFQFLAYFPSKLFLQGDSWTTGKMTFEIVRMLGTIVVLAWSVVVVYRIGLRRYSAFGG